jgi:MFS family permease
LTILLINPTHVLNVVYRHFPASTNRTPGLIMTAANGITKGLGWLAAELGLESLRSAGKDVYIIILARYLRLFAYGAVALILALYFEKQGFSDERIGLFMTLTLLGDVVVSLLLTLVADSLGRRRTLLLGSLAMAASGAVFATSTNYVALLAAAIVGVISPSGNEIGPFRAVEESTLAHLVPAAQRADVYGFYVILAVLGTSTGLIVGGQAVDHLQAREGWTELDSYRAVFWIYTAVGCVKAVSTLFLSDKCERVDKIDDCNTPETEPLLGANDDSSSPDIHAVPKSRVKRSFWGPMSTISKQSRVVLVKLCSLFFFDSFGSGLVPFSLVNFYLERKFALPKGKLGGIMSATWYVMNSTFLLKLINHADQVCLNHRQCLRIFLSQTSGSNPSNGRYTSPQLRLSRPPPSSFKPPFDYSAVGRQVNAQLYGPSTAVRIPRTGCAARGAHSCDGRCQHSQDIIAERRAACYWSASWTRPFLGGVCRGGLHEGGIRCYAAGLLWWAGPSAKRWQQWR